MTTPKQRLIEALQKQMKRSKIRQSKGYLTVTSSEAEIEALSYSIKLIEEIIPNE